MKPALLRPLVSAIAVCVAGCASLSATCVAPPAGLVAWWQGDSTKALSAQEEGAFRAGGSIGTGFNGSGFVFGGSHDALSLPATFKLPAQDFTVEAWIRRTDATVVGNDIEAGEFFAGSSGGFAFGLTHDGRLYLSHIGVASFFSTTSIRDTEWHHVAVSRGTGQLSFFVDGALNQSVPCAVVFELNGPYAIGGLGTAFNGVSYGFKGGIDELGIYARPLSTAEIAKIYSAGAAGKCAAPSGNLLSNGSFELPAYAAGDTSPPGSPFVRTSTLPGWEVAPSPGALDVELTSFGGTAAEDGVQCLDLEGGEGLSAYFIRQTVAVTAGKTYRLRFAYAKNFVPNLSRMRVELTGASVSTREFEHSTPNSRSNPGWQWGSIEFEATSSALTVQFTGISPNSGYGMTLDDISLTEVNMVKLPVANHSFEALTGTDPVHFDESGRLRDSHYSAYSFASSPGFNTPEAIPGWAGNGAAGTFNPAAALFPGGVPDGQNTAWINVTGHISQTLTETFQAGRIYRLNVDVGALAGLGFPGYTIGLYANGEVVAADTNSLTVSAGSFITATTAGFVPAGSPIVGAPIEIRLGIPGSRDSQVDFDNVRLTVETPGAGCVEPPGGLAAWYRAEATAADAQGRHSAAFTTPRYAPGKVGLSFEFDGSNEVVIPDSPEFNRESFALEVWVYPTALDGTVDIIVNKEAGTDLSQIQFELGIKGPVNDVTGQIPQGNLAFYLGGVTGLPDEHQGWTDGRANLPLNQWTHVALTVEPGTAAVFVNGVETRKLTGLGGAVRSTTGPLKLGSRLDSHVAPGNRPEERFNGRIDEFSFFTRALAAAEVTALYQAGAAGKCASAPEVPCTGAPEDLLAWYRGEDNAEDQKGSLEGTFSGARFAPGKVGRAFEFDGTNEVTVADAPEFNRSAFTIEAWIKPAQVDGVVDIIANKEAGAFLEQQQFQLGIKGPLNEVPGTIPTGNLAFYLGGVTGLPNDYGGWVDALAAAPLGQWTHVALAVEPTSVAVFVNGAEARRLSGLGGGLRMTSGPLRIGSRSAAVTAIRPQDRFNGLVDEFTFYGRALTGTELAVIFQADTAGKCLGPVPVTIVTRPASATVQSGSAVTFSVQATGTAPLSYQWKFNDTNLTGETNAQLNLTAVRKAAGNYSVTVCNPAGCVTSEAATLTVTPAPALVQIPNAGVKSPQTFTVPVVLVGNGEENAVSFGLRFNPAVVNFEQLVLGSGLGAAQLLANTAETNAGYLGVAIALPAGTVFPEGTNQLLQLTFRAVLTDLSRGTSIQFVDTPTARQLVDVTAKSLPVNWDGGNVAVAPADYEGDASPRPNGDRRLTVSDWVQVGRFVAALDEPTPGSSEFQRVDCAPLSTFGNGLLTVSDWVQAGRFAVGLDPFVPAAGPFSPAPSLPGNARIALHGVGERVIRLTGADFLPGKTGLVSVVLTASGDENALAFSIRFNPALLRFVGGSAGQGAAGATFNLNAKQAAEGRIGIALALPASGKFAAGQQEVVRLQFVPAGEGAGTAGFDFVDSPVVREVASPVAEALPSGWEAAAVAVVSPTVAAERILTAQGPTVELSWPLALEGAVLQTSGNSLTGEWALVPGTVTVRNGRYVIAVPAAEAVGFFRLSLP